MLSVAIGSYPTTSAPSLGGGRKAQSMKPHGYRFQVRFERQAKKGDPFAAQLVPKMALELADHPAFLEFVHFDDSAQQLEVVSELPAICLRADTSL